ncbi:transcriptional regulator, TENA/THI-4 family protein [Nesterenkonia sp. AN1]|uniref:TenA family protein n=1 Tax=Nesterenkonia sp. AN1 TaxID=652017 RepID=UPI0004504FA3|nr:TenA family protein [Nesterenkonia sp. AN1]EXF25973.1 transcriptional regulator, TENA/THI-4 family protein [Nesterenkonia sp. AN1]
MSSPTSFTTADVAADSFAGQLRLATAEDWDASVHHRFVEELFAGTLSDEVLARYLVQDYQFFDAFVAMLGACVATTDSKPARLRFAAQPGMLAADEDGYFQQSFFELDVPAADVVSPPLAAPTAEFIAHMWEVARSRDYADLLVVLVIAEWLYLDWGQRHLPLPEAPKHRGWIDLHRGDEFRAWTQFLIDELNRVAPPLESDDGARLTARWKRIVAIERAFFDAAYASSQPI